MIEHINQKEVIMVKFSIGFVIGTVLGYAIYFA